MPFLTVEDQFHLIEKVDKSRKNSELKEQLLETLGLKELRNSYPRDLWWGKTTGSHCVHCIMSQT